MPLGSKMAAPRGSLAPIDLHWEKHLLLQNHKAQSFHILILAMYSGPLYESCQLCPWGPYGPRPGGAMGKTKKNLLLRNHMAQSFHMLCGPMYNTLPYKCCQRCPWGPYRPHPRHVIIYHRLLMEIYEKNLLCNSMTQSLYI